MNDETSMNQRSAFANTIFTKDSDNPTCEFHTAIKKQLLSYESSSD